MTSDLVKPVITYPVNNSQWINNKFRVCFQLPNDPDKGSEPETYHYENVEININGTFIIKLANSDGTSSGSVLNSNCCSSKAENLTYQKKLVIYPAMVSGFPSSNNYTIKVRVKKKYGVNSTTPKWSAWSDVVNVTVKPTNYSVNVGDIIKATHHNTLKNDVKRCTTTYGINWSDIMADVVANNTIILKEQYNYNKFLKEINVIKNQVNNYATFDSTRTSVKFDSSNSIVTTFNQQVELITAAENLNNAPNGRNYIAICYDYLNKLI